MTSPTRFQWESASISHVGRVRTVNEDACLDQPEHGLWAVADGMGGHAYGELASRMIVQALQQLSLPSSLEQFTADARNQLSLVNQQLRAEADLRQVPIIGSTVAVLLACGEDCACLWAGDSRIYLCRSSVLKQLTRDHSQVEQFKSLHLPLPSRNIITRAVGAADSLELDYETLKVNDGDIFLLCSDGLSNEVSEQEICAALVGGSCRQAAEALVETALRKDGRDNISVVVTRSEDLDSSDRTVVNPLL